MPLMSVHSLSRGCAKSATTGVALMHHFMSITLHCARAVVPPVAAGGDKSVLTVLWRALVPREHCGKHAPLRALGFVTLLSTT